MADTAGFDFIGAGLQSFAEGYERAQDRKFKQMQMEAEANSREEEKKRQAFRDALDLRARGFLAPEGNLYDADPSQLQRDPESLGLEKMRISAQNKDIGRADKLTGDLRDKWLGNPTTKATQEVATAYQKVLKSVQDPSAAGDLSLIFSYMKMLDPGSTVREGEFANAQNAAGVPDQIRNMYNRAKSGERLNPAQRSDFANQAKNLYEAQFERQKQFDSSFTNLAKRRGIPAEDVVLSDMFGGSGLVKQGLVPQGKIAAPAQAPAASMDAKRKRLEELRKKAAGG